MSKPQLGKLLQGKIDVVAENVSRLAKEKNVAMDNYSKAKEAHIKAIQLYLCSYKH